MMKASLSGLEEIFEMFPEALELKRWVLVLWIQA